MTETGQRPRALLDRMWPAAGAVVALGAALWMWGFTVDDALIPIRYARNLVTGEGYRFNPGEASTDGVTPLPWAFVIAPLAAGEGAPLVVLAKVKALGLFAWCAAAYAWGVAVGRVAGAPRVAKLAALVTMGLSVPIAAYAVSGMETAIATSLATVAALSHERPRRAAWLAGAAAAFRPELAPWALVLAVGFVLADEGPNGASGDATRAPSDRARRGAIVACVALAPFVACALVRVIAFGRPAPLALMAKPSDVAHGLAYAGAALVVALTPLLVIAPVALFRERGPALAIVIAAAVHAVVIVAVGGDWMPYARLVVPVAPSLAYAFVLSAPSARAWSVLARGGLAVALGATLIATGGTSGRSVGADRAALVEAMRPHLEGARAIATLDVGWPSAASPQAQLIDLAGLTDPVVAALPGGHTSKRIDAGLLLSRGPDRILLYAAAPTEPAAWRTALYPRAVEARLARMDVLAERFAPRAFVPLGHRGAGYVVLERKPSDSPQ